MRTLDLQPEYLNEQFSKEIASRQILTFLNLPAAEADDARRQAATGLTLSKSLFSVDALPEGGLMEEPPFFNWTSRDIYDVDGLLLFRDQTIDLGDGNEWCVRTAASDLLRTPVWRVCAGPSMNVDGLIEKARAEVRAKTDLEILIMEGEEDVRLVCCAYPKLGILAYSRTDPAAKFVIDIGDLTILPLDSFEPQENPESVTLIWSPYDIVVRSTTAQFRSLWERYMRLLPALPDTLNDLPKALRKAGDAIQEVRETRPQLVLVAQFTNNLCAAATAKMIVQQHGVYTTQSELACAMHIGPCGTYPDDEVDAVNQLFSGKLRARLDTTPSFNEAQTEIRVHRPFKIGDPGHARAVGGFMAEVENKNWLHIYDPWPANVGDVCYEAWDVHPHNNFMYIQSVNRK